ncbi:uncharacterized protein LOC123512439 [Portunus trituberculatus]|uniref:uncharacterized protein LOC123512439 n=1 Tax=Portunus trituberculatus TaxID=210409 RepID=UPI001E1CB63D|nr:uncharacterized protein LOC123512439 [Portunus trituberculatus]
MKAVPSGSIDCEAFDHGLLELRNTPNHTGRSPAQLLYGHPLRTCVPAHPAAYKMEWQPDKEDCDLRATQREQDVASRYNQHARSLPALAVNEQVRLQNPRTKRWDQVGTVMAYHEPRQYDVRVPCGRVLRRNRRFLRPDIALGTPQDTPLGPTTTSPSCGMCDAHDAARLGSGGGARCNLRRC